MRKPSNRLLAALGCAAAFGLSLGLAEVFLRLSPPRDLHAYLGEASPLTGIYRPDPDFAVGYQSWEAFQQDNPEGMTRWHLAQQDTRKMWALFGNSFVQAPGMLGETALENVLDRQIFFLGKNEYLYIRCSQVKLLLEHGLRPHRIIMSLMPVDVVALGDQPLDTIHVTSRGAVTFRPRLPGGWLGLGVQHVKFLQTAWFRAGLQRGNRHFNKRRLQEEIQEPLLSDLKRLFGNLARITKQHGVPVTILLIPGYEQIHLGESCGFQETLIPFLRGQGLDVCFPIDSFRNQPDTAALFIPDKHFSPLGNQVLLKELEAHVRPLEEAAP